MIPPPPSSTLFPYTTLFRSSPSMWLRPAETPSQPLRTRDALVASEVPDRAAAGTARVAPSQFPRRSEEHTSELQSHVNLVCRLLLEKKKKKKIHNCTIYTAT